MTPTTNSNDSTIFPTREYLVTVKKRGQPERDFPVEAIDEGDAVRQAFQAAGVATKTEAYHAIAVPV
ncbi:hypothetical protein DTL42_18330 [Bremerella cremea]|uniref:Uncharacterized protein n=1 Tax=Bremerella cremea TaxID=1031537 RepID=A0A368KPY4_9BACT|nr:hypothetical protein [Bremerella cremea]RCS43944.1 hypothetical protein DTL42_18330 [Bremerella cremea]